MKKSLLTFCILSLLLFIGCEIQFLPDSNKKNESTKTTEESIKSGVINKQRNTGTAPEQIKPELEKTTGKIYAPGPEGIRPDNAVSTKRPSEINPQSVGKANFRSTRSNLQTISLAKHTYWYECDYSGGCWDFEHYIWYDCYYDNFALECETGNYWLSTEYTLECDRNGNCNDSSGFEWYNPSKDTNAKSPKEAMCCDSWGNCYTEDSIWMDDPLYLSLEFCDECGNCYDYYGNFIGYDDSVYDEEICAQYYYYDLVTDWDSCGNAYNVDGEFLFYDNYYYDYQACNKDYTACKSTYTGENNNCDTLGSCRDEKGKEYKDPLFGHTSFCDECGNCYDYYGNETESDESFIDDYWCNQYYQYDKVEYYDDCGNAYDKNDQYLFYDNDQYDYKGCYGITE